MLKFTINIFCIIIFSSIILFPQQRSYFDKKTEKQKNKRNSISIITKLEQNISEGNTSGIIEYLSPQTYFSLPDGTKGYFRSNQAYYILEDFFKVNKVISFMFKNINAESDFPYAIGLYYYESKGKRKAYRIFISLKKSHSNWQIVQLSIN